MQLAQLGWTQHFASHYQANFPTYTPGRISAELREAYRVLCEEGEFKAKVEGKLRHTARSRRDYPAVGDWVVFSSAAGAAVTIRAILPRRNCVVRQAAGTAVDEQIVGANIDIMFLVSALNAEFNARRIERYVALALESSTRPVIVLNKADLCTDVAQHLVELEALSLQVPVHVISALAGGGMDRLQSYLGVGQTIAVVGSSGVGKSTLINALLHAKRMPTGDIRASDGRGKHTTTHRSLVALPSGALLLDTPGMRELQLWDADSGIRATFADIDALRHQCRFSDCLHESEPGCAVRAALGDTLDEARFRNFKKLERERAFQERKTDVRAQADEKRRWKALHKEGRERMKFKR